MRSLSSILVGVVLAACSQQAAVHDSPSSADAVILIHDVDNGIVLGLEEESPTDGLMHRSSIKAWGDGRIVWLSKGASFEGHFDPVSFDALIKRLDHEGAFSDENARHNYTGPDSGYEVIEVQLADRSLRLESWHEAAERSSEVVGTHHGLELLEGRNREAVLAAQPSEYRRFRRIWSDIRSTVESWIPANGTSITR